MRAYQETDRGPHATELYAFFTARGQVFAPFLYGFGYIGVGICSKEATVTDLLYLVLLVGFFAVSAVLVYGCQRLMGGRP